MLAPIMVEAPKRATKFAANEQYTRFLKGVSHRSELGQSLSILAGVMAGITEAFVVVPFELASRYTSTLDCVRKILQQEGLKAFSVGLESTVWRHAAWNGGYFGSIYQLKNLSIGDDSKASIMLGNFVRGAIGGAVGTVLNTPFDVVKTRIQNKNIVTASGKAPWALSAMLTIIQEEGPRALYKGFVPKVLRLGPGGGILLVVFDGVIETIKKWELI